MILKYCVRRNPLTHSLALKDSAERFFDSELKHFYVIENLANMGIQLKVVSSILLHKKMIIFLRS